MTPLTPLEVSAVVRAIHEATPKQAELIIERVKEMEPTPFQEARFQLAVKSMRAILEGEVAPIIERYSEVEVKGVKGVVSDVSAGRYLISWEDGSSDWLHGVAVAEILKGERVG